MTTDSKRPREENRDEGGLELQRIPVSILHQFYISSRQQVTELEEARKNAELSLSNAARFEFNLLLARFVKLAKDQIATFGESADLTELQRRVVAHLEKINCLFKPYDLTDKDISAAGQNVANYYKNKKYSLAIEGWEYLLAHYKKIGETPTFEAKAKYRMTEALYGLSRAYEKIGNYAKAASNITEAGKEWYRWVDLTLTGEQGSVAAQEGYEIYDNTFAIIALQVLRIRINNRDYELASSCMSALARPRHVNLPKVYHLLVNDGLFFMNFNLLLSACIRGEHRAQLNLIAKKMIEGPDWGPSAPKVGGRANYKAWEWQIYDYDESEQWEDYIKIWKEFEELLRLPSTKNHLYKVGYDKVYRALYESALSKVSVSTSTTSSSESATTASSSSRTTASSSIVSQTNVAAPPVAPLALSGSHFSLPSVPADSKEEGSELVPIPLLKQASTAFH